MGLELSYKSSSCLGSAWLIGGGAMLQMIHSWQFTVQMNTDITGYKQVL